MIKNGLSEFWKTAPQMCNGMCLSGQSNYRSVDLYLFGHFCCGCY